MISYIIVDPTNVGVRDVGNSIGQSVEMGIVINVI